MLAISLADDLLIKFNNNNVLSQQVEQKQRMRGDYLRGISQVCLIRRLWKAGLTVRCSVERLVSQVRFWRVERSSNRINKREQ